MKKILVGIILASSVTALISCGGSSKSGEVEAHEFLVEMTDSSDYTVKLTKKPERIVSLAPSTSEIVAALGAEEKLVGRTDYCNYPEEIQDSVAIGGTMDPSLEKIIELEPDLVLASTHSPKEVVEKLRELDIPTVFLNEQEDFEGTYSAIEKTGALIGESKNASEIIEDMKETKENIEDAVDKEFEGKERPSIYFTNSFGENGDYAAGGDTFISEILEIAGGDNIAEEVEGWVYSKEELVDNDPHFIIVPSGRDLKTELAKLDVYKDLTAVKEGRVYEVNEDQISRQGPRVILALEEIAKIITPDINYEN